MGCGQFDVPNPKELKQFSIHKLELLYMYLDLKNPDARAILD